jgi:hypothetical protein
MLLNEFPFAEVASWLADGRVIPFLGAGASRAGVFGPDQLPDGRGLVSELINKMGQPYPGQPTDSLAKVAEYFEQQIFDRLALVDYLHDRFHQQQLNAPLSRVAQLLAAMPQSGKARFIVTTNYDSFVERAFREADRPLCVITQNMRNPQRGVAQVNLKLPDGSVEQDDALLFQWEDDLRFPAGTTYLFKMHGSADHGVNNDRDDLIITENDYVDFLANSGGPVSPLFPPVSLLAAFSRRRFLFLGYSLEDWNFRVFFRLLALRNAVSKRGRLRHWAVQLHPNELDVQLWEKRNVHVYNADLLQFCDRIETAWVSEHSS